MQPHGVIITAPAAKRLRPSMLSSAAPRHRRALDYVRCICPEEHLQLNGKLWPPFMPECAKHNLMVQDGAYVDSLLAQCIRFFVEPIREMIWPKYKEWLPGDWRIFDYVTEAIRPTNYPSHPTQIFGAIAETRQLAIKISQQNAFSSTEEVLHIINYEIGQLLYFAIAFWVKQWRFQAKAGPEDYALGSAQLMKSFFHAPNLSGASYVMGGRSDETIWPDDPLSVRFGGSIEKHSKMEEVLHRLDSKLRYLDYCAGWKAYAGLIEKEDVPRLQQAHTYPIQDSFIRQDDVKKTLEHLLNKPKTSLSKLKLRFHFGLLSDLQKLYSETGDLLCREVQDPVAIMYTDVITIFRHFVTEYVCGFAWHGPGRIRTLLIDHTCGGLRFKPVQHRSDFENTQLRAKLPWNERDLYFTDRDKPFYRHDAIPMSASASVICELCLVDAGHGHRDSGLLIETFHNWYSSTAFDKLRLQMNSLGLRAKLDGFTGLRKIVEGYGRVSTDLHHTRFGKRAPVIGIKYTTRALIQDLLLFNKKTIIADSLALETADEVDRCWGLKKHHRTPADTDDHSTMEEVD